MPVTGIPGVIKEGLYQMSLFTSSLSFLLPFSSLYLSFAFLYPRFPHLLTTTYENLLSHAVHPCSGPVKHLVSRYLVWCSFDLLMKLNPKGCHVYGTWLQDCFQGCGGWKTRAQAVGWQSSLSILQISLLYFRVGTKELPITFSEWIVFHYAFSHFNP